MSGFTPGPVQLRCGFNGFFTGSPQPQQRYRFILSPLNKKTHGNGACPPLTIAAMKQNTTSLIQQSMKTSGQFWPRYLAARGLIVTNGEVNPVNSRSGKKGT